MQVAEVSRPLASVKRICEAGHVVAFDEDGSFILNKMTGEINQLREESGNYMFDVWIPPKSTTTSFSQAMTIGHTSSRHQHERACGGSEVWGGWSRSGR